MGCDGVAGRRLQTFLSVTMLHISVTTGLLSLAHSVLESEDRRRPDVVRGKSVSYLIPSEKPLL